MTKTKKPPRHRRRTIFIGCLFLLWLAAVGVRAGYLQLYKGPGLSDEAADQYTRELRLRAKRGTIFDRNHQAMAVSIETTSVAAYPALITDRQAGKTIRNLATALNLQPGTISQLLSSNRSFVWLKRQATPKEVAAVKALELKGIDYLSEHARFYPNTTAAAQVLGFVGIDGRGLEGLEFNYNKDLMGTDRKITILRDAKGRGFHAEQSAESLGRSGNNIVLTIDGQIQFFAEQALAEAVEKSKALSGMALVMEPHSGAILALANYPFFNPNDFGKFDPATWRNRAITDAFEPGSTMKIFSAAAALENRVVTPSSIFFCENGKYTVGGHQIHDTKSHGWLSVQQIVKYSSNIGMVKLVEQLGRKELHSQLKNFGFGIPTHIDCPGEAGGSLSNFKRWTSVDTGAIAFGQGLSVTALQLVSAAAALANDGRLVQPFIVQAITDPSGTPIYTATVKTTNQAVSVETATTMRRIMRTVITEGGTGVQADIEGYAVCGKTGTAQKIEKDGSYAQDRYIASFVGLVPTHQPALAILVVVDEPKGDHYGGTVAAPAFRRIAKEALAYLNIAPDKSWQNLQVAGGGKTKG